MATVNSMIFSGTTYATKIILPVLLLPLPLLAQTNQAVVKGQVMDSQSKLPISGVNIQVLKMNHGTVTDSLGDFALDLQPGKYVLRFSHVGYESETKEVTVQKNQRELYLSVYLVQSAYITNEVVISANKIQPSPGLSTIPTKDLQNIPALYSDVLRSVTILPGVSSDNELSSAYNVRGQNFTSNLIYLDGFEIYRPYLIQQGIEESQSIINRNMVADLNFYDGTFPAEYGDKMSSVLVVNYKKDQPRGLGGEVNASLLDLGITLHDGIGELNWIAGFRYAYPSSFTSVLQTKGNYIPRYTDFQLLGTYKFPSDIKLEMLFITANNTFDLTPQSWTGDFAINSYLNFERISLNFAGSDKYRYDTNLLGLRLTTPLGRHSSLSTSFAYYSDQESYNENLSFGIFYSPSSYTPNSNVSQIGTGYEFANNSLTMNRLELKSDFDSDYGTYNTKAGIAMKYSFMDNVLNDSTIYVPPPGPSYFANQSQNFTFNSISGYVLEEASLTPDLAVNLGVRGLKYFFDNEFLLSPRASATFVPDSTNSFSLGWGYYYQPPSFYETQNKTLAQAKRLLSQLAVQYSLRYERRYPDDTHFMAEVYYKSLSRQLPYYYINQLELSYGDTNNYNGYVYGFDLQYEGKLSQRLDTWIGYDYLVARDRRENGPYQRSLLDQTHTIRIFLQDAMPDFHNSEAHVQLLFGTGYLYYPMVNVTGPGGTIETVPDFNLVYPYPFYYRVDMGLTLHFPLGGRSSLTFDIEVLNVFNKNNIVSYSWYTVAPVSNQPIEVPNLLSARYFNVGARIMF